LRLMSESRPVITVKELYDRSNINRFTHSGNDPTELIYFLLNSKRKIVLRSNF
jgi:hypothetical protein